MSALSTQVPSEQLDLLFALRDLAGEAAAIEPGDAETDAEIAHVTAALAALLDRALLMLAALQRMCEPESDEEDVTLVELDAWATTRPRPIRVADVCFAGTMELRRVARELGGDDAYVAAETAHRKLRRAIRAVLEAARESGVDVLGGPHRGQHQVADLASGLAVRRLYAEFRRSLRRAESQTPEAVLEAVRYAGGALATLVAHGDYADVRASDRAVLRGLRERALRWARHDRGVGTGLQLLDDVWTCSDLLRGINRRQELRAHDAHVIASCIAGPGDDLEGWLRRLEDLRGLDDTLDALVAARAPDSAILWRLEQLP